MPGPLTARLASRGERFDAGNGGRVKRLDERNHEVHGAIEVRTIDDAIVRMRRAGGHQDRGYRDATVVELDRSCVIAEAGDEIELQRDVLVRGTRQPF